MKEFRYPSAAVTGASSGIGLEPARQFADDGDHLLVRADDYGVEAVAALRPADPNRR